MFNPTDLDSISNKDSSNDLDFGIKGDDEPVQKDEKNNEEIQDVNEHPQNIVDDFDMTEEEKGKRDYLALKCKTFKKNKRLAKKLFDVEINGIENMHLDDVEAKYQEIKLALASKGTNVGVIHFGYNTSLSLVENMSKMPGSPANLSGLSQMQMANEEVLDLLTECEIEYSNLSSFTPPEYRLLYATISGAVVCANNNFNSQRKPIEQSVQQDSQRQENGVKNLDI